MKYQFNSKLTLSAVLLSVCCGCDKLPEAFSGKVASDAKTIQAVGPNADSMADVSAKGPVDLQSLENDPNMKMIDNAGSANGSIPAMFVNQSTELEAQTSGTDQTPSTFPVDESSTLLPPANGGFADESTTASAPVSTSSDGVVVVDFANLKFVNDIEVVAQTDGAITMLNVEEGDWISKDEPLVQLDSRLAVAELDVATKELEAARQKSEDKSEILYAKSAEEVAKQDLNNSQELMQRRVESQGDYRKKWLEHRRSELAITVAEIKRNQDLSAVGVNEAKKRAAEVQIAFRTIQAPFRGIVAEKNKDVQDWVKAGDVILRLVSLEKLRVVGMVRVASLEAPPHSLLNAPATVDIQIYPGAIQTVEGKVGFVSPVMQSSGAYKIWVEIPNQMVEDQWLFREGMTATIRINTRG